MKKVVPPLKSIPERLGQAVTWTLTKLIRFYQLAISPYIGSNCRHTPTCSNYMIQAMEIWGPAKGIWLGLKRIGKCHPWGTSGYDPVPKKEDQQSSKKEI